MKISSLPRLVSQSGLVNLTDQSNLPVCGCETCKSLKRHLVANKQKEQFYLKPIGMVAIPLLICLKLMPSEVLQFWKKKKLLIPLSKLLQTFWIWPTHTWSVKFSRHMSLIWTDGRPRLAFKMLSSDLISSIIWKPFSVWELRPSQRWYQRKSSTWYKKESDFSVVYSVLFVHVVEQVDQKPEQ